MTCLACVGPPERLAKTRLVSFHFDPAHIFSASCRFSWARKEQATGRILGATVVADGAGDVIQAAVYAIRFGLTTDQVASTWSPYLTFAEGFKLAAQTFKRDVSKLSCCAA
ncbi:MAG: hypothetical protein E6I71_02150 [Chloroflexi bacterium]|nr:MAG: hypothetical protein E6I71_02150 [Chloroflexota bacterium]